MRMHYLDLPTLLNHELQAARRYRRYVTLLMMDAGHEHSNLQDVMNAQLRDCDAIVSYNGTYCVLMTETTTDGAYVAIERLKQGLDANSLYALVTHPLDGTTSQNLIDRAFIRLKEGGEQ